MVVAKYFNRDYQQTLASSGAEEGPGTFIQMIIKGPDHEILADQYLNERGKAIFTSKMGGEHLVCLRTTTLSWFGTIRKFNFELEASYGERATDYKEVARQEHLSAIEVEIRKLNDKIRSIRSEQTYQRRREEEFRHTSEDTNSRVMWWSLLQTFVLLASGAFQIFSLQSFFREKKLA